MYQLLIFLHSTLRWFVLLSLLYSIFIAYWGYTVKATFSRKDDLIRHWTATVAHIQLMLGIILYTQSPLVKYFWKNGGQDTNEFEFIFFGLVHLVLMMAAIIILTIGSAAAKRRAEDRKKFKTMLLYYAAALLIIILAIPWPFSPLAQRPFFR